jgi:hypothetical protein
LYCTFKIGKSQNRQECWRTGTLDRETRGKISESLEDAFENYRISEVSKWAIDADEEIESVEDFILGYLLGSLMKSAWVYLHDKKCDDKLEELEHRFYLKHIGKEATEELEEQMEREVKQLKSARIRIPEIEVSEKELYEIRSMIIPYISQFRTKIRQEQALRKARGKK